MMAEDSTEEVLKVDRSDADDMRVEPANTFIVQAGPDNYAQTGGLPGDAPIREPQPALDLDAALKDLEEADDEAREEGFDPPAELAVQNARRLLQLMYTMRSCRYEVYPTSDREMAIYVPEGRRSVLVTCAPDGSARCSTSLGRKRSRTYYDPAYVADPPLGFLHEALAALDAS